MSTFSFEIKNIPLNPDLKRQHLETFFNKLSGNRLRLIHETAYDPTTGLLKAQADFLTEEGLQQAMSNFQLGSRGAVVLEFSGGVNVVCPNLTVAQLPMIPADSPSQGDGYNLTDMVHSHLVDDSAVLDDSELTICNTCQILQANWDQTKEELEAMEKGAYAEMERLEELVKVESAQRLQVQQELEEERNVREATIRDYERILQDVQASLEQERQQRETVEKELWTERRMREQWEGEMQSPDQKLLITMRRAFEGIARFASQHQTK